ncbi:uncharacterized protein NPIL_292841 [Nephila pilipes]|uniref:Mos1 transposase HTH domain-containing protein n=1 Tax=Nephila pilipes TaxID=299642 RepID=A0A8X6U1T1_NEPPI|nr:uncharacterized protein NPIL_292841 [Nephila pilipes]
MELNREHFRAIIFHNFRRGLSRQECFDELNSLYSDKAPSYSTVKNWYNEFNRGRCSIQDESRAGRPKSVVVPEKINAVRELIKQDRHVTYREIEASLDISMTSINKILHEHLSVKKICSRWIPHNLTNAQKKARVDWCKEMLEKYIQGTSKAVYNIYTGDESWIYAYEPETKQQSTVWVFQDEAKPTKVVRGRSTSKQMIACFFGINGHVATVALEQRRTVNSEWYTTICLPEVLLDIFSAMDGVSNSSPNVYLWVGIFQKYQQAFFTSRTRPSELRKPAPSKIQFHFAFGRMMNLVWTDLPSISTFTWVVRAPHVIC